MSAVKPWVCSFCLKRFATEEERTAHQERDCEQKRQHEREQEQTREVLRTIPKKRQRTREGMLDALRRRFVGKRCRYSLDSDKRYRRVVDVEIFCQPSAWSWDAKLIYEDGSESHFFQRMRDVEVAE